MILQAGKLLTVSNEARQRRLFLKLVLEMGAYYRLLHNAFQFDLLDSQSQSSVMHWILLSIP